MYIHGSLGIIFLVITILKAELLLPLNKLWMKFGLLLSFIVGPIVMGLIFFGMFTPIAFLMRLFGRDELSIKLNHKTSYWVNRKIKEQTESFKNQF